MSTNAAPWIAIRVIKNEIQDMIPIMVKCRYIVCECVYIYAYMHICVGFLYERASQTG